jgi:hypothetical protein
MTGIGEQDGVAVGGRGRDRLRRDQAAGAGTICDDDLLAESLRQVVPAVKGTTTVINREG